MTRENVRKFYYGCGAVLSVLCVPAFCVFLFFMSTVPDNWDRIHPRTAIPNIDFPEMQVRYKPVADSLAAVTQDVLLSEDYPDNNDIWQANNYKPNCVAGHVYRVYGTNRTFEAVLKDYSRFFLARPEWNAKLDNFFSTKTMSVRLTVLKSSTYQDSWAKYGVVYDIYFRYAEPDLGCVYINVSSG